MASSTGDGRAEGRAVTDDGLAPKAVAAQQKITFADSAVVAEVNVHATPEGGFTLSAAARGVRRAGPGHRRPAGAGSSRSLPLLERHRGNIDVTVDATVG
ncbi:hypothetical protein [Pseudonocardia adelaidensis]|uniref:Uncharacterized protein n=1 Tax=Pseudonocardia adelaidensis TaxID=648754 RepID=A0ABP9NE89_9PSEU